MHGRRIYLRLSMTNAMPTITPIILEFFGTLLENAELRTRFIDGYEHAVPVVGLVMVVENSMNSRMRIEHPFAEGQAKQAEAFAKTMKKGMRISTHVALPDVQLIARKALKIIPQTQNETELF
jgi:hypothetical protein